LVVHPLHGLEPWASMCNDHEFNVPLSALTLSYTVMVQIPAASIPSKALSGLAGV